MELKDFYIKDANEDYDNIIVEANVPNYYKECFERSCISDRFNEEIPSFETLLEDSDTTFYTCTGYDEDTNELYLLLVMESNEYGDADAYVSLTPDEKTELNILIKDLPQFQQKEEFQFYTNRNDVKAYFYLEVSDRVIDKLNDYAQRYIEGPGVSSSDQEKAAYEVDRHLNMNEVFAPCTCKTPCLDVNEMALDELTVRLSQWEAANDQKASKPIKSGEDDFGNR